MKKLLLFIIAFILIIPSVSASLSISPLKFEFDLNSKDTKKEIIKLTNSGDETITLYTSNEDFMAGDDTGTPKFVKPEDQTNTEYSLSNWIKVDDKNITLAPNETKEVTFSINVPKNAEPGGHYAAIFFSPGAPSGAQVAVIQRLGVLILVNIDGDVKIEGNMKYLKIGQKENNKLNEIKDFSSFPIIFETVFENLGNVHLKPTGKITLIDDSGETLKNIGKETISSPAGAYLGEKMVDYLPINDTLGNVLPKSERKFESNWEGFGYSVLNEDGTKSVKFKNLTDYYADKASEKAQFLMPWQSVNTRTVNKEITAKIELRYEGKDKKPKEFLEDRKINVKYEEKYIGLNYIVIFILLFLIIGIVLYFMIIAPKQKSKKEEELRRKIMEEMNKNK